MAIIGVLYMSVWRMTGVLVGYLFRFRAMTRQLRLYSAPITEDATDVQKGQVSLTGQTSQLMSYDASCVPCPTRRRETL